MALSEDIVIHGGSHKGSQNEKMSKDQYVILLKALHEMLEPGVTQEEAKVAAEKDWALDMRAHDPNGYMTFSQFFDSMFELCDTWVRK